MDVSLWLWVKPLNIGYNYKKETYLVMDPWLIQGEGTESVRFL